MSSHARSVTLVARGDALDESMSHCLVEQLRGKAKVHVALQGEVLAAHGDKALDAETAWLPAAIERDERGSPVKRVAAAVGEGSTAIAFVHQLLAQEG